MKKPTQLPHLSTRTGQNPAEEPLLKVLSRTHNNVKAERTALPRQLMTCLQYAGSSLPDEPSLMSLPSAECHCAEYNSCYLINPNPKP